MNTFTQNKEAHLNIGKLHLFQYDTTLNRYMLTYSPTGAGGYRTFNYSAFLPVGTKAVYCRMFMHHYQASGSHHMYGQCRIHFSNTNTFIGTYRKNTLCITSLGYHYNTGYLKGDICVTVPVNSSRLFYGYCEMTDPAGSTGALYVTLLGYYI